MKHIILLIITVFLFLGCSVKNENFLEKQDKFKTKTDELYTLILSISDKIDKNEAYSVAQNSVTYSDYLALKYDAVTPALFNNFLININIKKRGLCYHYANDLLFYLKTKRYKTFDILKVVANENEYFEHNSLIITRYDIDFKDSIILDAWRNSGDLFFSKVKDDKKYFWEVK
ncbi:hypothetical protein [Halarcobacter ebronensis]|uniref:Transglutaminase-like domain-containing protein n=1 Tax=Halarcobacter ebronensis TaxID=1462615 RepID=A0A4Q1AND8_9BACT|nr:hypothetical protein [Halarcobacter ebronensis]QKF82317.1 hypothetical protein AEBR_1836 [Halarcobacter ebronensis]RXK07653.1 hypothetical protein CRV07_04105 [Halarcobacter ebronensis]